MRSPPWKLLTDLAALEVAGGAIIDLAPVLLHALRNLLALKVGEGISSTKRDVQSSGGIESVAPIGSAKAITETDRVVASLQSGNDADLLPPPIADLLEDNSVGRINHNGAYVGLCFN